jgi:hypothetical protein
MPLTTDVDGGFSVRETNPKIPGMILPLKSGQ